MLDLTPYGIDALAVLVGGHTPGSLAVVGTGPGRPALVGDLVRGGWMGGAIVPRRPLPHYFSENVHEDLDRLRKLVERRQPTRLHLGHGGPVAPWAATALALARPGRRGVTART